MKRRAAAAALLMTCLGCSGAIDRAIDEPLSTILASPALAPVVAKAETYRLQFLLGTIEEDANGRSSLKQVAFRADAEYFYPASSVKLFAAIAALERLADLRRQTNLDLTVDTPLAYHAQFEETANVDRDDTNVETQAITLRHEIRKLFLVSDNEAFNRLYEFVGQDRLNESMKRAGLPNARIVHRLAEARSAEENRQTPQIDFRRNHDTLLSLPSIFSEPLPEIPPIAGLDVGQGYLSGDVRVDHPMDFAPKNRVSLHDLQKGLCKLVRPDVDCGDGGAFALSAVDRALLLQSMGQFPRESANPIYPPADYPDAYAKYLLPGLEKIARGRFRIYNKIGQAYGFTTENAWIQDTQTGRGFFLTATIYTTADGILNDDQYEYKTVALPFYADLGEALGRWFLSPPSSGAAGGHSTPHDNARPFAQAQGDRGMDPPPSS